MKLFSKLWSIFTTLLVVIVAALAILLAGVRLVGFTPYSILSPSMTPEYNVGDLVYVRKTAPENVSIGDTITYVYDESLTVVTHRVVAIDTAGETFQTKGDANEQIDGKPVSWQNVLGTAEFSLPYLGYLSTYLGTTSGRYAGIAAGIFLLLMLLLPSPGKKQSEAENRDKGESA